jgi:hypothetical protein
VGTTTYFEVSTSGPGWAKLTQVTADYSVSGSSDKAAGIAFLRKVAALPYAGGDPTRAVEWLQRAWGDARGFTPAEKDIGPGHFVLRVLEGGGGSDYSLELYSAGEYYG